MPQTQFYPSFTSRKWNLKKALLVLLKKENQNNCCSKCCFASSLLPYITSFYMISNLFLLIDFSALPISSLYPFLYFMVRSAQIEISTFFFVLDAYVRKYVPTRNIFLQFLWLYTVGCLLWFIQIRDLDIAKREEDIGFYAGFVGKISVALSATLLDWNIMVLPSGEGRKSAFACWQHLVFLFFWRIGIYVRKSFDFDTLGNGGWSLWKETSYYDQSSCSVNIFFYGLFINNCWEIIHMDISGSVFAWCVLWCPELDLSSDPSQNCV